MEQERVTLIVLISTIVVLVFAISMVVLTSIYISSKQKLQSSNETLKDIIRDELNNRLDL